ncbi:MAG TPA: O-antigen ligase family protein [Methylomirabilota bacterium]|nr:O-antigen ligase family protein [Methylomirabilota bacterium]
MASGAWRPWPLAVCGVLLGLGAAAWLAAQASEERPAWRRTPLDLPVTLLFAYLLVQLVLGNRALVAWALAPAQPVTTFAPAFPAPFLTVGSVLPRQTFDSTLLFAAYVGVYYLVVNAFTTRHQLGRLVRGLVILGGLLGFFGLIDYLSGETWLLAWRDFPEQRGRLTATWGNPDHVAAWLAMTILLGLGWLSARAGDGRHPGFRALLGTPRLREELLRRYLPMLAVVVMALALVFTLSRGGVLGVGVGLLAFLLLLGAVGRARRSALLAGVLLVGVGAYGAWIGFGPLLERFGDAAGASVDRFTQYTASLGLFRDFPLFGVGLGAYREIYFRYQPAAHSAGVVYYPYAHNDVLQLAIELGPIGTLLCLFFGWRVVADLVGTHLLGRGACPVDGGEGEGARRHDRWSLGVAIGALAGAAALTAHSVLDFNLRIPANGFLAAALLGIATVALHTRFSGDDAQLLSGTRAAAPAGGARAAVVLLAVVLVTGWTVYWARSGWVGALDVAVLKESDPATRRTLTERLLARDPWSPRGLNARAHTAYQAALAVWSAPPGTPDTRRATAGALLANARADLRAALAGAPTNPFLHASLAWVEATDAVVRDRYDAEALAPALSHGLRAVALATDNAGLYESLARLAYTVPEIGVAAAREAIRREPARVAPLVDLYRPLGLSEAEWLALAPARGPDRLDVAAALEARGLVRDALALYGAARDAAAPGERPLYQWALATALARAGDASAAAAELAPAVAAEPGNPELQRALGETLARRGDPAALDHLRQALAASERPSGTVARSPFAVRDPRLAAWITRRAGEDLAATSRYRRALARYLLERRFWDQAAGEWERLVADAPKDAEARYGLGVALEALGASDRALEAFRAAVALAPGEPRYRERLAQRLWESEQYYQAMNEWRTVRDQAPRNVGARLSLARAYEKVGDKTEAYREYRAVLELEPGNPDATRALTKFR